jgi:glycosyltransferase involved in cell wall biosynthesis
MDSFKIKTYILAIILILLVMSTVHGYEKFTSVTGLKKIDVSVILLLKNNEFYVKKLDELFTPLENDTKFNFTYFIYENNSTDKTKEELVKFIKNRKGRVIVENLPKPKHFDSVISKDRGIFMGKLRNKLKKLHGDLTSDFTLLIDSDVIFTKQGFDKMFNAINDKDVMITPYSICWKSYKRSKQIHYYDALAKITKDNISYKENANTCMFHDCKQCINYRRGKGIKLDNKYLIKENVAKVNCAFAGFCLIKTDIYNKVKWSGTICEHHSFCERVRKFGNILLLKNVKTVTLDNIRSQQEFMDVKNVLGMFNKYYN